MNQQISTLAYPILFFTLFVHVGGAIYGADAHASSTKNSAASPVVVSADAEDVVTAAADDCGCEAAVVEAPAVIIKKLNFYKKPFEYTYGSSVFRWENKIKFDGTYTKNAKLLNDRNCDLDKVVVPGKFTWDSGLHHYFRNEGCDWDTLHMKVGIRMKGIFGAPQSALRTGPAIIKDLEVVAGAHNHPIEIIIPFVRELWGEFLLNDLLHINFGHKHYFTMGIFPYSLGRGISLGDAYAMPPDFIGWDPASAVDQYAPGFKLAGTLIDDHWLDYDLYAAIDDNFSDSFNAVNLKTQGQFYGHRINQARGFGIIDYTLAGSLKWTPLDTKTCKFYMQPYALYNDTRAQRVEVPGDASSKLGTIGLAFDMTKGNFEFGFEVARNFGHQSVKGLDRNVITKESRITVSFDPVTGLPTGDINVPIFVNSHVVTAPTDPALKSVKAGYNVDKNMQAAIDAPMKTSTSCSELEQLNGQIIPDVGVLNPNGIENPIPIKNAVDRFRDPYCNKFCGKMFVADASYKIKSNLKFAGTVGYASGDENPNKDLDELGDSSVDGTYCGFIGLQEMYSGKRVRSLIVLNGSGKFPRVLSYPVSNQFNPGIVAVPQNEFPSVIYSHFTNLTFVGFGVWYETEDCYRKWEINPNILTYWQPFPPRIFDVINNVTIESRANKHLGTELNLYVDTFVQPGLRLFLATGFFISGKYYDDVKGHPLTKAEKTYLDSRDRTGEQSEFTPTLGNDNAFFLNAGIEYRF